MNVDCVSVKKNKITVVTTYGRTRWNVLSDFYYNGIRSGTSDIRFVTGIPVNACRLQLKCDGTRWRTGGEMNGKLSNGVGSQYSSHNLGTWCIQHYYRWCAHLACQQSTELTPSADLNRLVHFAERRNLVSARVITFQTQSTTY